MEPLFLSLDEILEMHQQQIDRYGGSHGIRDVADWNPQLPRLR
jgi:hypothetical protein